MSKNCWNCGELLNDDSITCSTCNSEQTDSMDELGDLGRATDALTAMTGGDDWLGSKKPEGGAS